jgi:DMSO/TMAO reductase YedYZ molybdopterin-dependent catalytic subunit
VVDNEWKGVSFKTMVEMANPENNAKYVVFESADRYSTCLPLADLLESGVLLAYELNGDMLDPHRGGPVRLIVPQKYAYKSAMWLQSVRFTDTHELGYWEKRGYSDIADPWKEDRYAK